MPETIFPSPFFPSLMISHKVSWSVTPENAGLGPGQAPGSIPQRAGLKKHDYGLRQMNLWNFASFQLHQAFSPFKKILY
jgi:hypothetical protein